jgi:two-component system CheB/CheR fusion protein
VIVHHLDPTHESNLVEILSRAATMPVHAARHGERVLANHAYVVPPNAGIFLADGLLHLAPRVEEAGLHLPIDRFFRSLAEDCKAWSIGILLSGSASDGSLGIRAIKAAGGITFVQDASAEYRSMPESAIATGCVDAVLPPPAIAAELLRIGERPALALEPESSSGQEPEFVRLLIALRKASGIDFGNYKSGTIRRRLQRRLLLHRMVNLSDYIELVEREPAEASALAEEVLIHVTSFFRDPATFQALETTVYPRLMENGRRGTPIRVWVPGCSTGEEVYSLAISLLEFLARSTATATPLKVFGTDVSVNAVEKARAGKYAENIERDVSRERLTEFFVKTGGGYQIRKDVREACVFARQDATRDPPFSGMDIISCRNLMIYLGPALQARTLAIFHYALREPGFLVLGSAETLHTFAGFEVLEAKNKIYQRTSAAPPLLFDFSDLALSSPNSASLGVPAGSSPLDVHREADRLVLARFAPPGMVVTDDLAIVQFRGKTSPYLDPAPGPPSFDLLRMVREELRLPLRRTIDEARSKQSAARQAAVRLRGADGDRVVDLEVLPLAVAPTRQRFFVVLFLEAAASAPGPERPSPLPEASLDEADAAVVAQLRQELTSTREYLESVIEQLEASNEELKAANEEITSSNEELRSTNEELQVAKEEIHATNEELRSVNDEMAVRTSEAVRLSDDLTNVLSSIEIPILLIGRDTKVRRFAPAAARVLQLRPADVGRQLSEMTGRLRVASTEMAAEVLANLTPVERTLQDESGHWYQLTARPYLTLDNRIDGTVIAAFDIDPIKKATESLALAQQERAREALERSENEFRDVLTTAAEGILMTDATGSILFANPAVTELFGYEPEELLGQPVERLVPARLRARHLELRATYLEAPAPRRLGRDREIVGVRKDGTELSLELTISPVTRAHGQLIVCFVTDVTARRASEQRIAADQEKLRQMAFDAALAEDRERRRIAADLHDQIGQSLALAQMKLRSLQEAGSAPAAVEEAIALLAQSIADTRTLIFDLSPPILYELGLEDALSWLAEDLGKRWRMSIEVRDDGLPKPLGEATAGLLFRAVRELLGNVLKHAQTPAAQLLLRRSGDEVHISVEDHGVGFDPHATVPSASSGGFGLFSVREQIHRLGGAMEIQSAPGAGTRVTLRLPLALEHARSSSPSDATGLQPDAPGH